MQGVSAPKRGSAAPPFIPEECRLVRRAWPKPYSTARIRTVPGIIGGTVVPSAQSWYNESLKTQKGGVEGREYRVKDQEERLIGKGQGKAYRFITLREAPEWKETAAEWFHSKWRIPREAYLECMEAYLSEETEYGWYLCLDGERIIGGMGVIKNDFHERKDLFPNVCAVYTEEDCRGQGIAGRLLDLVVEDMRSRGISPLYLLTDHTGFYERYGWEYLCPVRGDGEAEMSRMYIHR